MNLIYLVIIIVVLLIIVEILSLGLRLTGLEREKATFQVISILTGTGFTTSESELITQHKARREIASMLMLVSYVGQATIIGAGVGLLTSVVRVENVAVGGVIALVVAVLLFIIAKNKYAMNSVEKFIKKKIKKSSEENSKRTVAQVLKLDDGFGVVEFMIDDQNPLVGVSLNLSDLKSKQIQVLNVERGDSIIKFPKSNLKFRPGDIVLVYGDIESISKIAADRNE